MTNAFAVSDKVLMTDPHQIETVVHRPKANVLDASTIPAIVSRPLEDVSLGEFSISSRQQIVQINRVDLAEVVQGDTIEIKSVSYTVDSVETDGTDSFWIIGAS